MRIAVVGAAALALAVIAAPAAGANRAYILNEDSHPHEVAPGASTRFTLQAAEPGDLMDVKCSLGGDGDLPLASVTLRTHGLAEVRWPYATRTIGIARQIDFDIQARIAPGAAATAYFEFVNGDPDHLLWHQCYNN